MKPLKKLDNIDRAKIIFQLFPDEMPGLIKFTEKACEEILQQEQTHREQWKPNHIISFNFWIALVTDIKKNIDQCGSKLARNCRWFTDQLFDGYLSIVMAQVLEQHSKDRQIENPEYALAVCLFFPL